MLEIHQVCDVAGFHPDMPMIKNVPIRTCACVYDSPSAGVADNVFLGRWLGVAHNIRQAMTYWILNPNGYVIARSIRGGKKPLRRLYEEANGGGRGF
jgi:hypothetical protein